MISSFIRTTRILTSSSSPEARMPPISVLFLFTVVDTKFLKSYFLLLLNLMHFSWRRSDMSLATYNVTAVQLFSINAKHCIFVRQVRRDKVTSFLESKNFFCGDRDFRVISQRIQLSDVMQTHLHRMST